MSCFHEHLFFSITRISSEKPSGVLEFLYFPAIIIVNINAAIGKRGDQLQSKLVSIGKGADACQGYAPPRNEYKFL